jgi:hypothetical protein
MDMLYERENKLYIMDHKTTSIMGPSYFQDFELSSQVFGYLWAAERIFQRPISGFIVNGLGIRKPTKTGKAFELVRHAVNNDRSLLEEWQRDTTHDISNYLQMCFDGYLPKRTKWCSGKYGQCQYFTVCQQAPESREFLINSGNYKEVTWNPLA